MMMVINVEGGAKQGKNTEDSDDDDDDDDCDIIVTLTDEVLEAFSNLTVAERGNKEKMQAFVDQYFEGPNGEFETWEPSDYTERYVQCYQK